MKAIILAAGVGKRIRAATGNRPKCLLEFGGRSLLVRYLDAFLAVGGKSAVLVVGRRQDLIRDAVGESHRGLAIRYVVNDQYRLGSLYSLWLARGSFDDDLLIMDSDVLCPASFVRRLVTSPHPNALLIDETALQDSEERMAIIRGGRVVALTKGDQDLELVAHALRVLLHMKTTPQHLSEYLALVDCQHADGGWGKVSSTKESAAWVTAFCALMLIRGNLYLKHPRIAGAVKKCARYFLETQKEDGKWSDPSWADLDAVSHPISFFDVLLAVGKHLVD